MDWKNTTFSQVTAPDSVPDSCCIHDAEDCGKGILKVPDEVILDIMMKHENYSYSVGYQGLKIKSLSCYRPHNASILLGVEMDLKKSSKKMLPTLEALESV